MGRYWLGFSCGTHRLEIRFPLSTAPMHYLMERMWRLNDDGVSFVSYVLSEGSFSKLPK